MSRNNPEFLDTGMCVRHVEAAKPVLLTVTIFVGVLGLLLIAGGIYLGFLSRLADTQINLLGSSIKSTSVGVALAFLGAVMVVRAFARTLRALERLAALPPDDSPR